jgi:LuxR family transcriptional regulator, quorum-sensing system regulator BjaR1
MPPLRIANETLDAISALEQAPSILKVKEIFRRSAERHGFTAFLCAAPPSPDRQIVSPILFEEWPEAWTSTYVERRHYVHDPMLKEIFRTADPFLWSEAMAKRESTKAELTVMAEAEKAGMNEGFVIPIYGVGGAIHAFTMTGEAPRTDSKARAELHLLSMYAYARARRLRRHSGGTPVSLTMREREALRWVAQGKSDWEIGEIMGTSDSAAHKLIESAKRKCNVSTRIQAVVIAIRQGDIPV